MKNFKNINISNTSKKLHQPPDLNDPNKINYYIINCIPRVNSGHNDIIQFYQRNASSNFTNLHELKITNVIEILNIIKCVYYVHFIILRIHKMCKYYCAAEFRKEYIF